MRVFVQRITTTIPWYKNLSLDLVITSHCIFLNKSSGVHHLPCIQIRGGLRGYTVSKILFCF